LFSPRCERPPSLAPRQSGPYTPAAFGNKGRPPEPQLLKIFSRRENRQAVDGAPELAFRTQFQGFRLVFVVFQPSPGTGLTATGAIGRVFILREMEMGLLDGILGGVIGAEALSLVKGYVEKHGGIEGVVAEFEKTGYGQQVKSWVGTGGNLPISAEDIKKVLGSEKIKELAAATGLPVDKAAEYLAQHLPTAVDKSTPDGTLPPK
jgi:uncharacterized protein YidB (DUF937 family)